MRTKAIEKNQEKYNPCFIKPILYYLANFKRIGVPIRDLSSRQIPKLHLKCVLLAHVVFGGEEMGSEAVQRRLVCSKILQYFLLKYWTQKHAQSGNIHSIILDVRVGWQSAQNFLCLVYAPTIAIAMVRSDGMISV